ncbi:hypothetical protein SAMN05216417_1067 [Nitrosospira multiformis]|uniref:Uncharacterized protein n=1 Tax=Nitrosospira multiformis TaxID=1231 RepID=A0A1I7GVJ1_9PROT|nr:hypothetical protein SAMN05216417_1067 [Nitrosospira multiformis]
MDFKRVDTRQTIAPLYKACRLVSLKYRLTVREEMQSASNHHCCGVLLSTAASLYKPSGALYCQNVQH